MIEPPNIVAVMNQALEAMKAMNLYFKGRSAPMELALAAQIESAESAIDYALSEVSDEMRQAAWHKYGNCDIPYTGIYLAMTAEQAFSLAASREEVRRLTEKYEPTSPTTASR